MKRRTLQTLVAVAAFFPFATSAFAQKGRGGGGQKNGGKGGKFGGGEGRDHSKDNQLDFAGEVQQITSQGLLVESTDGLKYLIAVAEESRITFGGPASRDFLKPGQLVEFEVELDRAMRPVSEVETMTFVDPSPLNPIGRFPTGAAERPGRAETTPIEPKKKPTTP